jgi:hypothetical protein
MTTLYTSNVIQAMLGITGHGSPRNDEYANAIQFITKSPALFWVKKKAWMRNVPITALEPTRRQIAWWVEFASAMHDLKNQYKGNTPTPLPQDSHRYVKTHGKAGHAAGEPVLPIQAAAQAHLRKKYEAVKGSLPASEKKAKPLHDIEQLKKMLGK